MMSPLVSIIMPARNMKEYVADAIRSVLNQKYLLWELIVVENASTDETADIIRTFTDQRIRLVHTDVPGLSNARNIGLDLSLGELICFLDADDMLPPLSLSSRVALLEKNPGLAFADGRMEQFNSQMTRLHHTWTPSFKGNPYEEMMLLLPGCFCGITWMIRASVLTGQRFDTTWTHLEDRVFYLSIAPYGNYGFVDDVVYHIRRRPNSLMSDLRSLESAYMRYMAYVIKQAVLSESTIQRERVAFHRMFFRTYAKRLDFMNAVRHAVKMV